MFLLDTLRLLDFSNLITVLHETLKTEWEKGLFNQKGKVILSKSSTLTLIEDPTLIFSTKIRPPMPISHPTAIRDTRVDTTL